MSHIEVRKAIGCKMEYAGRRWWYDFQQIPELFCEEKVAKRSDSLLQQFAGISKNWEADLNSEWVVRIYYAAKMVLGASIMAQSLKFSEEKNLRSVVSYLSYYTVMHSLRAIAFTSPQVSWNDGEILKMTHSKTINIACAEIESFNRELAKHIKKSVLHLKAFRELISYRAPSSGDNFSKPDFDVYDYCRCFLEIAQLHSELLEVSLAKNSTQSFDLNEKYIQHVYDVEIEGVQFHDKEDWYRIEGVHYSVSANLQCDVLV